MTARARGGLQDARIDWESVHAVLLVDHVTRQLDRAAYNIHFRERRLTGVGGSGPETLLVALALDNENCFGRVKDNGPDDGVRLKNLVRWAAQRRDPDPLAMTFSQRLQRGLQQIDVEAWSSDLVGLLGQRDFNPSIARLSRVKEAGLMAIIPQLAYCCPFPP